MIKILTVDSLHIPTSCLQTARLPVNFGAFAMYVVHWVCGHNLHAEKFWKHGTVEARRGGGVWGRLPLPSYGGVTPRKFLKKMVQICAIWCIFGDQFNRKCTTRCFARSIWWHWVIKSGTENRLFSMPVLKVAWNLPYMLYTGWSKKNEATLHFPKYLENYWR